ncbi:MAG: helix-turn-helix domain-containing protein [Bacteroidia bacterium]
MFISFTSMHIGEVIDRQLKLSSLTKKELADRLGVSRSHIYTILERPSIDTDLLVRISKILNYNFFNHYQSLVPGGISASPEELTATIRQMREKISYLEEINDLLREKAGRKRE